MNTYGVFGKGMLKNNALLTAFLQSYANGRVTVKRLYPVISQTDDITAMLGWGRKKSYRRASRFAHHHDLAMLTLEDGFLRSLTSGKSSRHACSMVIDPVGIYFDAKMPSYLEQLINDTVLTEQQRERSENLIQKIVSERLSKYNGTPKTGTLTRLDIDKTVQNILLIDQVAGDQSITGAGASKKSFAKMLKVARQNHPNATLWIKAHPAGKIGYLTELKLPKNCHIIRENINPIVLLENMDEVYTVSSHMGFEALLCGKLMCGKTVHCFGVPWYAGWGLTDDSHCPKKLYQHAKQRRSQKDLATLFYACYLRYSHYADPATGQACEIEQAIDWLVTNRDWREKLPSDLVVYEFSKWKYPFVRRFLQSTDTQLQFKAKPKTNGNSGLTLANAKQLTNQVSSHIPIVSHVVPKITQLIPSLDLTKPFLVWGLAKKQQILAQSEKLPDGIWCMEDGFIRSNGLGASLIEPLSVVIDHTGIYYDATKPSDLETILANQTALTQAQTERVERLFAKLLTQKVSKYNVGEDTPLVIPSDKYKILVVGQVEDDMSVKLCGSDIKTNLGLLKQVRHDNPHAYILYKPHPDVQAGLRTGKIADSDMAHFADQVVLDTKITDCLDVVDEVATISSLTGFEALLRGLKVTCYGLPFYAGWGLTNDKADNLTITTAVARRQRDSSLTLNQLVKGALIDYPLYRLPHGYGLAQVEQVIDFLYQSSPENVSSNSQLLKQFKQKAVSRTKMQLMQTRQRFLQR